MKKFILIFMSLIMLFSLAACGQNNSKDADTKEITATPAEIESKIKEAIGKDNYLCDTDIAKNWLSTFYQLDTTQIEDFVAKENSISAVNLDSVIILKVKDGYADTAVEKLNRAFAQTISYIRQYPFGTAKVLNARLYNSGNYVVFVIAGTGYDGEDAQAEAKLAEEEYDKIDAALKSVFGTLPKNLAVIPEDNGSNNSNEEGGAMIPDDYEDSIADPVIGG